MVPATLESFNEAGRSELTADSKKGTIIWEAQPMDILCGRGAAVNFHHGNHVFRDMVKEYQTVYLCSKRSDKPRIAAELMELVRSKGGRFLRRIKTTYNGQSRFAWEEIGQRRRYEKVCQALREGAPELRRQMMATATKIGDFNHKEHSAIEKENRGNREHHDDATEHIVGSIGSPHSAITISRSGSSSTSTSVDFPYHHGRTAI